MVLGPVVFDLISNLTETENEGSSAFAKHEIVQGSPIYEAMGEDESTFDLEGVIHPELGVNGALAALEDARKRQLPLPMMRGDFRPLGWFIIRKLKRKDGWLGPTGVGREIRFSVSLIKTERPSGGGIAREIVGIFS